MSTYFDIACCDCKAEMSGSHGRDIRNDEALQSVVDNFEVYVNFAEISGLFDVTVSIGQGHVLLSWLVEHRGHRIAVKCEYEDFDKLEARLKTSLDWWTYNKRNG